MGASLFQGLGYGLATAGKGVGHAFQYANKNIPGGFRGAAVRILTQDPTAGRPNPQQAQQDAEQGYTAGVARPPNSTLGLPSTSQQYDPGVAVKPVLVQPQQQRSAWSDWYERRYGGLPLPGGGRTSPYRTPPFVYNRDDPYYRGY